jgi:hypothetical protein
MCFALEFFGHVYDPLAYSNSIDQALTGSGLLITNISDHHKDFMHVSPKLAPLRAAVKERRYEDILANFIFSEPPLCSVPV